MNICYHKNQTKFNYYVFQGDGATTKHSKKCVFWDHTLASGHGDWSSEGCETISGSEENNGSIIECHCSHLTNFAVLLVSLKIITKIETVGVNQQLDL